MARDGGSTKIKGPKGISPRASVLDATSIGSFFLSVGERGLGCAPYAPCRATWSCRPFPFPSFRRLLRSWQMKYELLIQRCLGSVETLFNDRVCIVTIALPLWTVKLPILAEPHRWRACGGKKRWKIIYARLVVSLPVVFREGSIASFCCWNWRAISLHSWAPSTCSAFGKTLVSSS